MADWQLKAVLSANAESMLKTLKVVNRATRTTRKYLMDVGKSGANLASQVGMPLGLISGALAAFSVAGIKQVVTNFAALGDQAVKSATRLGVSTDEYQRLKYAAGQSGVSVEGLASSMGRLNKGIALAATGKNKDLAALFKRAGISMRDANGNMRKSADLLPEIADLFERNKNAAVQARMGNAIFGKGWQELAPLLNGGKKGIEELNERYEMLGLTMDENSLKAGEAFGDQLEDLQHVTASYGNVIASKLIPALSPLIEKTIAWAVANREMLATKVAKYVEDVAIGLSKVDWSHAIASVKKFVDGLKDFIDWIGGAKNALIALVVVMNAQTIAALASLIGSVARAGWAFLVMAANAYIAGNASLLAMLRVAAVALFVAGPIGALGAAFAWLGGMAASAGGLLSGAMGLATAAVRGLGIALMANPLGVIIGIATAAYLIYKNWDTLKAWFSSFFDWVGEKFKAFLGWAQSLIDIVGGMFGGGGGGVSVNGPASGVRSISDRPSLVGGSQVKASGQIEVSFKDAPPGMRVEQTKAGGDVPVNTNVGYRSYATNAQY